MFCKGFESGSFYAPFFTQSTGAGIRSFSDEVNSTSGNSVVALHPEDFMLCELGIWDESNGVMEIYDSIKPLGLGIDYKRHDANISDIDQGRLPIDLKKIAVN